MVLAQSTLLAAPTAKAPWQIEQNAGVMSDTSGDFKASLVHYQNALKTVPPNLLNENIELKCQTAIAYQRTGHTDKLAACVDDMLQNVSTLRKTQKLSTYSSLALHALVDVLLTDPHGLDSKDPKRVANWRLRAALLEKIGRTALPETRTASHIFAQTRVFLALGDKQEALKFVEKFAREMSPADPMNLQMRLNQAALKRFIKQPDELDRLMPELQKRHSYTESIALIAKSQTWATDYSGGEKTVEDAFKNPAAKTFTKQDRYNLLYARLWNAMDWGNYPIAEQAARESLALNVATPERKFELTDDLIMSLEKQKKMKEAAAIKAKSPHGKYDFLIDDEKEVSEELARKHAKDK